MGRAMARWPLNGKPTFLWQGLLIVLPVTVLAVLGAWSLRQDKVLAQHEATERAKAVAEDLVPKLWTELTGLTGGAPPKHHAFEVDSAGRLLFPPACSPTPLPGPFNLGDLDSDQARLWQRGQREEASGRDRQAALGAYRDFLDTKP